MTRLLQGLHFVLALICFGVLSVLVYTLAQGHRVVSQSLPEQLGNTPEKLARLADQVNPDDIAFAAMGDVKQGTATFAYLLDLAAQDNVDFAVILGDFVSDPEPLRHRLFIEQIRQIAPPFPIILVPGNHDVHEDFSFTADDFSESYGQAQFDFVIGRCQFIVLNNVEPYDDTGEYLTFLEQAVTEKADAVDQIFVFMHVPPKQVNEQIKTRPMAGAERFVELCKSLEIDYVFTGDHHGYVKTVLGPTTYIVTGGGGDRLRGDHGQFHHVSRIHIDTDGIIDSLIAANKQPEWPQRIERNLILHVFPLMIAPRWGPIVTIICLLGLFFAGANETRLYKKALKKNITVNREDTKTQSSQT